MLPFASIEQALDDIRAGKIVIVVDDENRENEGDLIMAAEKVTAAHINFMTQYGRGLVCMPAAEQIIDQLGLAPMVKHNTSKYQTNFTVSIGARQGVTTGISAYDRAHTVQVAVNANATSADISSPGHIFPLRAQNGGVPARAGHTEATVDLARLAGLKPAGILCEVMNADGHMARLPDLALFAKQHGLNIISIADLITYRVRHEVLVDEVASAKLPVRGLGDFIVKVFTSRIDHAEHVVIMRGPLDHTQPVLTRLHSECLTGDIFNSARCDCGNQLHSSLQAIAQQTGVVMYLAQEGRGIGLANKVRAYALQDQGMDTVEANQALGFNPDERDYAIGAQILKQLGVTQVKLLTNNPNKIANLTRYGIAVTERMALETQPTGDNVTYLQTKRDKLGHLLNICELMEQS